MKSIIHQVPSSLCVGLPHVYLFTLKLELEKINIKTNLTSRRVSEVLKKLILAINLIQLLINYTGFYILKYRLIIC